MLVLVVPVAFSALLTPDSFSASAIRNKMALAGVADTPGKTAFGDAPGFTLEDFEKMVPKNARGNYEISVIEIFYSAGDPDIQNVLSGLPVETVGQLLPGPKGEGDRLRVFRLYVECCAADARPVSVSIEFATGIPDFTEMGWYKVTGKLDFLDNKGVKQPLVRETVIEVTDEPPTGFAF